MKNQTVVKRYARALLEIGVADGQYAKYGQELQDLTASIAGAGELAKFLTSPVFPDGVRRKAMKAILDKAALSPMVNNFVNLLMDKGRLTELGDISAAYKLLANEVMGVIPATIVSARPLSANEIEAITASLRKFAERKVELTVTEDPGIIGGLIAKMGDLTIDGSVRTQLSKLAERLDNL